MVKRFHIYILLGLFFICQSAQGAWSKWTSDKDTDRDPEEKLEDLHFNHHHATLTEEFFCIVEGGFLSSLFGFRIDPLSGKKRMHAGIDVSAKEGTDIKAIDGGEVVFAGSRGLYGKLLEIRHPNGLVTRYGHTKELLVQVGEWVRKGQTVALLGKTGKATGPHVHFEVRQDGLPVDPFLIFPELKKRLLSKYDQ
jgi:murein DD-endopeptidase MepM/ murein hydrolase activator NlpD